MRRIKVSEAFATVGAREDIDGACPRVVLVPSRDLPLSEQVELTMEPATARALARRLNRWAKFVSSR